MIVAFERFRFGYEFGCGVDVGCYFNCTKEFKCMSYL